MMKKEKDNMNGVDYVCGRCCNFMIRNVKFILILIIYIDIMIEKYNLE